MYLFQPLFPQVRRSAHPNPVIKFFDIERLLRPIDNGNAAAKLDPNHDEADDEEEVNLRNIADDGSLSEQSPAPLVSPSHVLPMEGDEEFNLASVELEEILVDGPVAPRATKGAVSHLPVIINDEDKEEEDAGFELSSWV